MASTERNHPDEIQGLIRDLGSQDAGDRKHARQLLIQEGKKALPDLIDVLLHGSLAARLESAKALSVIKNPAAAPAFIKALEDDDFGVRWNAMDGLINLEKEGLEPLLQALRDDAGSVRLREGAHRILRVLNERDLLDDPFVRVLEALDSIQPDVDVPWAAEAALKTLEQPS